MYIANYRRKVKAVFLIIFFVLLLCIARLCYIQFFHSQYLSEIARKQQNLYVELEPRRGTIYDVNLRPQAVNISSDSVYASPNTMSDKDKEKTVQVISSVLGSSGDFVRQRLSRDKSFVWLARKIGREQSDAIRKANIKGIGLIKESKRCYPNMYLASHVIGFAGTDNVGLEGLERYYDGYLKGRPGWAVLLRDARQKKIDLSENMALPSDGYDVVLTIDEVIQYIAERELDKAFKKYNANAGTIIVMNPYTGEILAMANRPTFDLNEYSDVAKDVRRNRAVCDLFEPGSVFKIVTASAALEEKKLSEHDRIFCENGSFRVANHILHDHTSHGWLTFREVIEESSNIGTTKVAQMLGPQIVYNYGKLFGFGSRTNIDIAGEINGVFKDPRSWSKTSIGAIPIGQEVGVTAIQLVSAYSAIANGGSLMRPYLVRQIRDKRGEVIKSFSPAVIQRVISEDTSMRMKKILTGVMEEGTGKLARVDGFTAAGKTGTAQKLEPNGVYSHNKFVASFIGFAPAEEPVVAIAVILDNPHPAYFGGVVSAPVFSRVASDVLKYLRAFKPETQYIALNDAKRSD